MIPSGSRKFFGSASDSALAKKKWALAPEPVLELSHEMALEPRVGEIS